MQKQILGKPLEQWLADFPLLVPFCRMEELTWFNPGLRPFASAALELGMAGIRDAAGRLDRFAPLIRRLFPETEGAGGRIESDLVAIPQVQRAYQNFSGMELPGRLWMKRDDSLPISGSIKARGGIYEVLKHAESLAVDAGLLTPEADYEILARPELRNFFSRHRIMVGSTGNLGLSIGIMGAALGFRVTVHMSADARQWKKELLRSKGVTVAEYEEDYGQAVRRGRKAAQSMERCHFVDDENSRDLFLGYSVAGLRLKAQLDALGIQVDEDHPLCVYLPCGVGGGPGGVAFGLKQVFGDDVHCFFAEPTHSACMFLGLYTGLHDRVSVQDFGVDNLTCADGLAVGRASALVGRIMGPLMDGVYTVSDKTLYRCLALVRDSQGIELEPSALAGLPGIFRLAEARRAGILPDPLSRKLDKALHLVWATGGNMVPRARRDHYYRTGKKILRS